MARKKNLLANRTAAVEIQRNGLSIAISGVPAVESGQVAAALLDAVRNLVAAGYEELIVDAGGATSGALGEFPDEDDVQEAGSPVMRRRRIGFL